MAASQILFKFAAMHLAANTTLLSAWVENIWLWASLISIAVGGVSWMLTLRSLPLSFSYPWTAIVYAIVPALGAFFFNEQVTWKTIASVLFIIVGILITTMGWQNKDHTPLQDK